MTPREFWIEVLERLAAAPLAAMEAGALHRELPLEHHPDCHPGRIATMRLELTGRILAGIAPWLACPSLAGEEAALRDRLAAGARTGLVNGSDPAHPDSWQLKGHGQALVDAAFLAEAFLRAPDVLWEPLEETVKERILCGFRGLRQQAPWFNNWLLFSATIEAFLATIDEDGDPMRIDYAIRQHEQWYLGDGRYADGPIHHEDYYNSFVIHPMLFEVLEVGAGMENRWDALREPVRRRLSRYAAIQERMIGPDGTWPVVGRSICYRTGAFHALAFAAWQEQLPDGLSPSAVRCAMTAVLRRGLYPPANYDSKGWLRIGLHGHQPSLGETYITTASCYLASFIFPVLGLPPSHPFWSAPDQPWTARSAWELGEDLPADHPLPEK
jgi:hypothetical protein